MRFGFASKATFSCSDLAAKRFTRLYKPWYDWSMIQSFTGTFDAHGVRSLRIEADDTPRGLPSDASTHFWAVLDSRDVPLIHRAIVAGDRKRALKLISDHSLSMGTILRMY